MRDEMFLHRNDCQTRFEEDEDRKKDEPSRLLPHPNSRDPCQMVLGFHEQL